MIALLVVVGLWIRFTIAESPEFQKVKDEKQEVSMPIVDAIRFIDQLVEFDPLPPEVAMATRVMTSRPSAASGRRHCATGKTWPGGWSDLVRGLRSTMMFGITSPGCCPSRVKP